MSRTDELILQQMLCSAAAMEWLERLAASFFDREAKKQILGDLRAALPALAPALDADGLQRLGDGLFQELCRQASRDAPSPSADAPLLSGPELEDLILQQYPYPIAVAYHALTEQDSAAAGFGCLLDTFEALIHYLATVVISAYLRTNLAAGDCNRFLLEMLLKRGWSTGDLFALLRETVRQAGDCDGQLPYPLPALLFTSAGKPSSACLVLESFVNLRNRKWGHGTGRTEESYREILAPNCLRLEATLARMSWLANWQLLRPVAIESGRVTRADLLNGCLRKKARPFDLALAAADLADAGGDIRADRDTLLLASPRDGRYLPLYPLALFQLRAGSHGQEAYFLQRCAWQTEATPWRLARAGFVAYKGGCPEHEEGPREFVAASLERHADRLRTAVPGETLPTPPAEPTGDPDHTLPEVLTEQQSHLRGFVGREAVLSQVADWIDGQGDGGYLLILGPPGQGKSALMAELARREMERGGCLLHMVKSHRNPLRFVPALVSQAARLASESFGAAAYTGDLDDLRNAWVKGLEAVVCRAGRAVVVLDALDELEAGSGRVTFLPPALPRGVRVILTCRPDIPLVLELRARLRGSLEEQELGPLTETDFRLFLERRLEAGGLHLLEQRVSVSDVFARLGGNPLFLHCFADDMAGRLQDIHSIDLTNLPTSLEAVFRSIYDLVRGRRDGQPPTPEGRQRARLLQFICVAREALTVPQLAGLLKTDGQPLLLEDVCDHVEALSQWLLEVGRGRFKPWHQGLADYARGQALGQAGVKDIEGLFCRWMEKEEDAGAYGLRHRITHLLAAGVPEKGAELLLTLSFLEAKTEAGMVFELAEDFTAAIAALPGNHESRRLLKLMDEALRREIHFIAWHAQDYSQGLFQCLWNLCWWYDSPEAAAHYVEPQDGWRKPPPWARPGAKLHSLLTHWRNERAAQRPGFAWLRALRPPEVLLGTALQGVLRGHTSGVTSVAFSPDGRWLASGSLDKTLKLWDMASGQETLSLCGHTSGVTSIVFSPDGRLLATGSHDGAVAMWDATTGEQLRRMSKHRASVWSVAFNPDGQYLVSGSSDKTVTMWNAANGQEVFSLGHSGRVWSVAFSPDGRRLATSSSDREVKFWDVTSGQELYSLSGHEAGVRSVAFSPDGRYFASGSLDKTVKLWDAVSGKELRTLREHTEGVWSVVFSPDGQQLASASLTRAVKLWDATSGQELLTLSGNMGRVGSVAFSPDGRYFASGSFDRTVKLWDTTNVQEQINLSRHTKLVRGVAFSPDGRQLASGSLDTTVKLWDAATGQELLTLRGHTREVWSVAFSPDGRQLASGSLDKTVKVWDTVGGKELLSLSGHWGRIRRVAYSPNGRQLASGGADRIVKVWDTTSGKELLSLSGHTDQVRRIAFSPEGLRLASGSDDNTERLWDLQTGKCLAVIQGQSDALALVGGVPQASWRAFRSQIETVVLSAETGQPMAWWPSPVGFIAAHPSGRTWAGSEDNYLCLFTLEGADAPKSKN